MNLIFDDYLGSLEGCFGLPVTSQGKLINCYHFFLKHFFSITLAVKVDKTVKEKKLSNLILKIFLKETLHLALQHTLNRMYQPQKLLMVHTPAINFPDDKSQLTLQHGLFQKKSKWGSRKYFSENPALELLNLSLLEIPGMKTSFHPWKFCKIVWQVVLLRINSKFKNQDPWMGILMGSFSEHPMEILLLF